MPKVSVNIITHNRKILLQKAIKSVLSQSFEDFELIIVDDGSTDNTEVVVSQFQDKRIKYKKLTKQKTVTDVRNKALDISSGKYIALLDDDDVWIDNDKLKKQVYFLNKHPDYVLIGTGAIVVNEDGNEKYRFLNPQEDEKIKDNMLSRCLFVNSSTMFKNETAK
ncbi:MAG TPA: glycosyltransferase family A protein, partial [Patescibacteria group bacterium]|nr:glycosyltransferase family A protein [Patescibacteria group bacterium]